MKRSLLIATFILFTTIFAQGQTTASRIAGAETAVLLRSYPNPATAFVTFEFEKAYEKGFSIQVFNFLGKKVYEGANLNQRTTLYLTDFPRGVYIYQLRNRSGKMVESGKFQVSK